MQQDSIERIRSATFPISRKGYEKREVERFLAKLADWLEAGGGDQARSELVKRELERVGEKTANILAQAEDSAEQLRAEAAQETTAALKQARQEATASRKSAEEYAAKTRAAADQYADKIRQEADRAVEEARTRAEQEATQAIADAQAKARRIVEEGAKRRSDIEEVISDLVRRRDALLGGVTELVSELKAAVAARTPEPGADPFATPSEVDPDAREAAGEPSATEPAPEPEPAAAGAKRSSDEGAGKAQRPKRARKPARRAPSR